eukprot:c16223_g2_i3.p1 GENE.c16223_g2_i3~~c16223_g2_i3.p1  ORF type:complete len:175 (+),score=35.80 c16223_g2_i3:248-772(+)
MPVQKMAHIGTETSLRLLEKLKVRTVRDLAKLPLEGENAERFEKVLSSVRKSRGRTKAEVLCSCIRAARKCVRDSASQNVSVDPTMISNDKGDEFGDVSTMMSMSDAPMTMVEPCAPVGGGDSARSDSVFSPYSSSTELGTPNSSAYWSGGARLEQLDDVEQVAEEYEKYQKFR